MAAAPDPIIVELRLDAALVVQQLIALRHTLERMHGQSLAVASLTGPPPHPAPYAMPDPIPARRTRDWFPYVFGPVVGYAAGGLTVWALVAR